MANTQLDLFKATAAHEPHDGFLYYASFTQDLYKRVLELYDNSSEKLYEETAMFAPVGVGLAEPEGFEKPDYSSYFEDLDIPEGGYIDAVGCLHIPGSMYHFTHRISPLRNASSFEEIESYPYPTVKGFTSDHMKAQVDEAHARGKAAQGWVGHMYESSWQIRGYEEFLMDMMLNPEWCEFILDKLKNANKIKAVAAAEAGVDLIRTGDDVANQNTLMFSKEQWRKFMKPRWAEVYAAAREVNPDIDIWYHSDGNIEEIIPDLIEIGVTILNPVQPECLDPAEVQKQYGDKLVIDGAVGTQTVMPFGTAEDVKRTIKELASTVGRDGAYIISPTHVLEPEVPLENIQMFFNTCKSL